MPELMDDPLLDGKEHLAALKGLARLNQISGSAGILWKAIATVASQKGGKQTTVLDVATGYGDNPLRLTLRAKRCGLNVRVDGCDFSQRALNLAGERALNQGTDSRFFRLDVLKEDLPSGYDVVMTSLFTHHLTQSQVVQLLKKMTAVANNMVLVSDLDRGRVNLAMVGVATRLVTRSRVVHFDGPASVRASYTMEEIELLAKEAELKNFSVARKFPGRMLLTWKRD